MRKITTLLADDHPLVLEGIRSTLKARDELEVVAEASTSEEACHLCVELRPELAVIGISTASLDALEVIRSVRRQQKQTRFLVLSIHDQVYRVLEVLRVGALGYLLKHSPAAKLLEAIDAVRAGTMYLDPAIATRVATTLARGPRVLRSWSALSRRELQVLKLTAEGYSSKDISVRIGVSDKTVNSHRSNLMKKLEIRKVTGLVRYAIREGIIAP
jgi:DNA-binding NarL/FixJ family response regulator